MASSTSDRGGHAFAWDEDALVAQAKGGLEEGTEVLYVGCLPGEVEPELQDVRGGGIASEMLVSKGRPVPRRPLFSLSPPVLALAPPLRRTLPRTC